MATSGRDNHDEAARFHPGQSCDVHFGGPCSSAASVQAKIPRHYAGVLSTAFWEQIKSVKDPGDQDSARFAGVLLQELEERVLAHIERAPRHFVQTSQKADETEAALQARQASEEAEVLRAKHGAAVELIRKLLKALEETQAETNKANRERYVADIGEQEKTAGLAAERDRARKAEEKSAALKELLDMAESWGSGGIKTMDAAAQYRYEALKQMAGLVLPAAPLSPAHEIEALYKQLRLISGEPVWTPRKEERYREALAKLRQLQHDEALRMQAFFEARTSLPPGKVDEMLREADALLKKNAPTPTPVDKIASGEVRESKPDAIEALILRWREEAATTHNQATSTMLLSVARELERACIGPDPGSVDGGDSDHGEGRRRDGLDEIMLKFGDGLGTVPAKSTVTLSLLAVPGYDNRPFYITHAAPVDGIDYSAFTSEGMFIGSQQFNAPTGHPWPLSEMFSGFVWPRSGGISSTGGTIPYIGQSDFNLWLTNNSDRPQPFAIKLVGKILGDS